MRILHIQRVKGIGGSERHLLALLPALAQRGLAVRMCVLETGDGHHLVEEMRKQGIDVTVQRGGSDLNLTLIPALVSEIRRFRPDVVHTHLVHADVYGQVAAALARVPGVSSVHGTPAFYRRAPLRQAGQAAGRLARRRIAISAHVARFVEELGLAPVDRIRIVHYGIDAERFTLDASMSSHTRDELHLPPDALVVGIASRLIPGKGHDVLIQSVSEATRTGRDIRLLVVGDGPERASLEALARRWCRPSVVHFTGFAEDVRPYLGASDVLAFPTQQWLGEGFGLAALEAMATGKPVVASRVGSLPEVVDDGVTGVLVPPASVTGFSDALIGLADDPARRARFGRKAALRAREVFPLESMVSRTIDVYGEMSIDASGITAP